MTKLLITTIPWLDEGEYDAVDPTELINVLTLFDDADWLVIGTDRYTLDHEIELTTPTKVRGARNLAQSIVDSGDTLVTQSNLDNWNDMDIIDWLEAKGYMWDADLLGWVIHIQL